MPKHTTVAEYVAAQPDGLRDVLEQLIPLVDAAMGGAGALWHGAPTWSAGAAPGKSPVCMTKAYSSYIAFTFWRGQLLGDTKGGIQLEPGAREMAHVKLRSLDDIDPALFATWIARAKELETQSVV
ncbi:DUF1801 domain-containing protein [Amycolatopsis sp. NBC_00345]|uniref:DUF1801 domain-containing protein n=1 Tax=Amycolatopsis sp. NBC_00345 TaxID=2975955 RepID=UPI002E26D581